jgi:methylphosphotriester-DNA--protein-cysteine methyltransferase
VANRVFFLNERHARAAGYRACKVCFDKRKKRSAKKTAAK